MDNSHYDVVVVGLGIAGASTLNTLARRGINALGIDLYEPPHAQGSSHGQTRLVRAAYAEGGEYVPFVLRAIDLWLEFNARTGEDVFCQTGVRYTGPANGVYISGASRTGAELDVGLVPCAPNPGFDVPEEWNWLCDPKGGFVWAERAIALMLAEAKSHGATIATNCRCLAIDPAGKAMRTSQGSVFADQIIVTAGGWAPQLLPNLDAALHAERQTLHWFNDPGRHFSIESDFLPFVVDTPEGALFYGFPTDGNNQVKVAQHQAVSQCVDDPADLDRTPNAADASGVVDFLGRYFPGLAGSPKSTVCFYPMAQDDGFIIDRPDELRGIVVGVGLSGHGFKFGPAIGEALADIAAGVSPSAWFPSERFRLNRFKR